MRVSRSGISSSISSCCCCCSIKRHKLKSRCCFDRNSVSLVFPHCLFEPDDILLYRLTSESISFHCLTGTSSHDSQQPAGTFWIFFLALLEAVKMLLQYSTVCVYIFSSFFTLDIVPPSHTVHIFSQNV